MMIQDIAPRTLINHYDPSVTPAAGDTLLVLQGAKILCRTEDGQLTYPTVDVLPENEWVGLTYLFSIDEERFFLHPSAEAEGFSLQELRSLREENAGPKDRIFAAYTAKHLADWYRDTRFCGRCGHVMEHSAAERAMTCPSCHYTAYPRIMPAVIVGVTNGDRLLLTRYRTGYGHNALIAGFTEIGETLEETVAREVMEEAGIHVKNIRYYKSQPWGTANDILVGYFCDVDGDDTIRMDEGELKFAQWTERQDILLQPDNFSLTNEMMTLFKNGGKV